MLHMKILMVNGEAQAGGIMEQAMHFIGEICMEHGIFFDLVVIDQNRNQPCIACGKCYRQRRCQKPGINDILDRLDTYDGLVIGGKVQYGKLNRETISFINRLMRCGNDRIAYLPAAVFVSFRKHCDSDAWGTLMKLLEGNRSSIVNDSQHCMLTGKSAEEKAMICEIMEKMISMMKDDHLEVRKEKPLARLLDYMR